MKNVFLSTFLATTALVTVSTNPLMASKAFYEDPRAALSNSSYTPIGDLTPVEMPVHHVLVQNKLLGSQEGSFEEILAGGKKYRLGYVMGDNDCGLHSLNAQFPNLGLTRENLLALYAVILGNPNNPNHADVKKELANGMVVEIRQLEALGQAQFLPASDPFLGEVVGTGKDADAKMELLFSDAKPYVNLAMNNVRLLKTYIDYLKNTNNQLLSLSEDQGEYKGTFGLVCQLYKLNVVLFNYSDKGEVPSRAYSFDGALGSKPILFRNGHFSPLCDMKDALERNRLAAFHIRSLILPQLNRYKNIKLDGRQKAELQKAVESSEREVRGKLVGELFDALISDEKPVLPAAQLEHSDFADKYTIEAQMEAAKAESARMAGQRYVPAAQLKHSDFADKYTIEAQMEAAKAESTRMAGQRYVPAAPILGQEDFSEDFEAQMARAIRESLKGAGSK